jgi:hypothetical protein
LLKFFETTTKKHSLNTYRNKSSIGALEYSLKCVRHRPPSLEDGAGPARASDLGRIGSEKIRGIDALIDGGARHVAEAAGANHHFASTKDRWQPAGCLIMGVRW